MSNLIWADALSGIKLPEIEALASVSLKKNIFGLGVSKIPPLISSEPLFAICKSESSISKKGLPGPPPPGFPPPPKVNDILGVNLCLLLG